MSQRAVLPVTNLVAISDGGAVHEEGNGAGPLRDGRTDGRTDGDRQRRFVTSLREFRLIISACARGNGCRDSRERERRKGDICASQEGLTRLSIPCRWAVTFHSSSEWRRFSPEHWNKFCHTKRAKIYLRSAERKIALILLSRFRRRPASATSPKRGLHCRCRSGTHEEMDSGGGAVVLGCFAGK